MKRLVKAVEDLIEQLKWWSLKRYTGQRLQIPHLESLIARRRASLIQNNKGVEKYCAIFGNSIETQTLCTCPFHRETPDPDLRIETHNHDASKCPVSPLARYVEQLPVCFYSEMACWLQLMADISDHGSPKISMRKNLI